MQSIKSGKECDQISLTAKLRLYILYKSALHTLPKELKSTLQNLSVEFQMVL